MYIHVIMTLRWTDFVAAGVDEADLEGAQMLAGMQSQASRESETPRSGSRAHA